MWIFLAHAGFFSVVQRDGHPDQLVVRARDADDLKRLKKLYLPTLGETIRLKGRDYPVRAYTTKEAFSSALALAVKAIEFTNFKAETARAIGAERAATYHEVWAILHHLEPRD
ncbi:MAG: hypothetical protein INH41_20745 [Myxococcaceae bacterium]|jgi:hypothetical protein|nr:hypothetical protein [Myxococcaceae bacterium]